MAVFGSILAGSSTRFKTQPGTNQAPGGDAATFAASKTDPEAFSGMQTGPEFDWDYEAALAYPADGSDKNLRSLSPFMIQVEPPLVYSSTMPLLNTQQKRDPGRIVEAAYGVSNPFSSARQRLQAAVPGMDRAGSQRSVEEYLGASAARQQSAGSISGTVDKSGSRGTRLAEPSIADLQTAVDISLQLKALVDTPPLVLLINPQSLSMKFSKVQQFTDRTRFGYVFQAWGEEQPVLSIETRCGAFYAAGRGVTGASRRDSASWNNMMALFQFYRNNGYIYDTIGKSNAHHLVGALSIHYDGWIYYGNMSSFGWSFENANELGGIVISIEFTVSWMVDTSKATGASIQPMRSPTASPSDPRHRGYRTSPAGEGRYTVHLDHALTSVVSATTSMPSSVRSGPTPAGGHQGRTDAVPGQSGFRAPDVSTVREPQVAGRPSPFRAR